MEIIEEQRDTPVLRIWLCGPLTLEWIDPATGQGLAVPDPTLGGRDRAAALSLLCLLLCQPGRQAYRDWIMEQFWPEGSRDVAIHRLENIFSCLRKMLLIPSGGGSLLTSIRGTKNQGMLYCLSGFPKLWVDADALTWQVDQAARMERFGDDALPSWERAYALLKRGPFLPDEFYANWVYEFRDRIAGYMRQCVHALAHLSLEHYGKAATSEVLLLLRTYWQSAKTDEDVLRPMLEILGEQERYQEAEEYYQQLLLALADEEPDDQGKSRQPDPRTQDMRDYLRTKQTRRPPHVPFTPVLQDRRLNESRFFSLSPLPHVVQLSQMRELPVMETISAEQDMHVGSMSQIWIPLAPPACTFSLETALLDVSTWFGARVNDLKAFGTIQYEHAFSCQQQQDTIYAELKRWEIMTNQNNWNSSEYLITRRTALAALASLPTSLLLKVQVGPLSTAIIEEFLTQVTTSITTSWHILNGDNIAAVEYALPKYLPLLVTLAKQPSKYQKAAAYLASQGSLLMDLLAYHRFSFEQSLFYAQQAVELALVSGDRNLHIYALMLLGGAFDLNGQPKMMLQKHQEAESYIQEVVPPLKSYVLAELAYAYAQNGQVQDALRSIEKARDFFPDEFGNTPLFLAADYGLFQLIQFEGQTHLALGKTDTSHLLQHSKQASHALAQAENLPLTFVVPQRSSVEITNLQTTAAVGERNVENFEKYLIIGARGANALASKKRKQEAILNWKNARDQWPHDKRIVELADVLF